MLIDQLVFHLMQPGEVRAYESYIQPKKPYRVIGKLPASHKVDKVTSANGKVTVSLKGKPDAKSYFSLVLVGQSGSRVLANLGAPIKIQRRTIGTNQAFFCTKDGIDWSKPASIKVSNLDARSSIVVSLAESLESGYTLWEPKSKYDADFWLAEAATFWYAAEGAQTMTMEFNPSKKNTRNHWVPKGG